jgi:hypothetical protein
MPSVRHTALVATVTGQRRRVPSWRVVLGIVAIVAVAWAVLSLGSGEGAGGVTAGSIHPLLPGRLYREPVTPVQVVHAFAAEGLPLTPTAPDLEPGRFRRLRSHMVAAYELSGRSAMLIVLFDRPEPRAATTVRDMGAGRDFNEAAGRVYIEYDASGLNATTASAVRRAFRRLQ